jgi:hypothetical protein
MEGERHRGILIDFDHAFVVELCADSSMDGEVENTQAIVQSDEARNGNQEENSQATVQCNPTHNQNQQVSLHRTVYILIQ